MPRNAIIVEDDGNHGGWLRRLLMDTYDEAGAEASPVSLVSEYSALRYLHDQDPESLQDAILITDLSIPISGPGEAEPAPNDFPRSCEMVEGLWQELMQDRFEALRAANVVLAISASSKNHAGLRLVAAAVSRGMRPENIFMFTSIDIRADILIALGVQGPSIEGGAPAAGALAGVTYYAKLEDDDAFCEAVKHRLTAA